MKLIQLVPDVDTLLAMPDPELGHVLLRLASENLQHGLIHPVRLHELARARPGEPDGTPNYPQARMRDIVRAIDEGVNWLISQNLLVPDTEQRNGHMSLSRRAERLLAEGGFDEYARAIAFPKSMLHRRIADDVWHDLARGDLDIAVFRAFREVEIAVREAGNYPDTEIGIPLMRRAFGPGGPLHDPALVPGENDGVQNLFAGAIGIYKNPGSHRVVIRSIEEAQEMVVLASHLLRIVDTRR